MTLRASTLGTCLRCQTALELGYSEVAPPAVVQGWYERGQQHEVDCIAVMRDEGWTVTDQQHEVEFLGLTGHLDGLCGQELFPDASTPFVYHEQARVLEVKAPSAWARFEHAYRTDTWTDPYMHTVGVQLSVYMHAMGMEAVVASLLDGRVQWFVAERPPFGEAYLEGLVEQVREHTTRGELPPCSQHDWPCRTRFLCEEQDERIELDDPDLVDLLSKDRDLGLTIAAGAAAEKERKKLREGTVLPVGKYQAGDILLTVYEQKGRSTLDEARMIADGINPDDYRVAGPTTVRWKVGP